MTPLTAGLADDSLMGRPYFVFLYFVVSVLLCERVVRELGVVKFISRFARSLVACPKAKREKGPRSDFSATTRELSGSVPEEIGR